MAATTAAMVAMSRVNVVDLVGDLVDVDLDVDLVDVDLVDVDLVVVDLDRVTQQECLRLLSFERCCTTN